MTASDGRMLYVSGAVTVGALVLMSVGLALPQLEPLVFVLVLFGIVAAGVVL